MSEVWQPGDHGQGQGGTCPLCGDEYDRWLRDHLPCDPDDAL